MSLRVMLIPEDYTLDQYIARPLAQRLLLDLNRPQARLEICTNPRFRGNKGTTGVLNADNIVKVIQLYPMYNVFIALVDADGDPDRQAELDGLERDVSPYLSEGQAFLAEDAHQELEVWLLAGLRLPPAWRWEQVRSEPHPKEEYYLPYAQERGVLDTVGGGRKVLMDEAMQHWTRIQERCPQDVGRLRTRLAAVV